MAQKSRSDYTMLNIVSGLGGYAINFVLGLVCRMVFTRVFTAEYLGVSGLFNNILNMLSLAELGITNAIVYALYKPLANDDKPKIASLIRYYGKCYRIIAVVVLVLGLAIMPFLDFIIKDKPDIDENIYLLYLISLFNTVSGYLFVYRNSLLGAAQKRYIVTAVSNIVIIGQSLIQIVLMLTTKNYIIYMLIISASTIITNVINSEIAKKQYPCIKDKNAPPISGEEKKSLSKNIRALTINRIGGLLVNSTDNIITTFVDGLATTGLASNYTLFSDNINTILTTLFASTNASVGNHRVTMGEEENYKLFKAFNLSNFWLYGLGAVGIFTVSTDAVALAFGSQYVLSWNIPLIIAINFYMVGMQKAVWSYMNIYGIFRPGRYLVLLTAAINIVLSILLGQKWGLFGVLLASAISRVLTNTWYSPYALFKYGFKKSSNKYFVKYLFYILVLVSVGFVCYALSSLLHFSLIVNVLLKFLICCVVYNVAMVCIFCKSPEFKILWGFVERVMVRVKNLLKRRKEV